MAMRPTPSARFFFKTIGIGRTSCTKFSQIGRMRGSTSAKKPWMQGGCSPRYTAPDAAPSPASSASRSGQRSPAPNRASAARPSPATRMAAVRFKARASQASTPQRQGGVWIMNRAAVVSASDRP